MSNMTDAPGGAEDDAALFAEITSPEPVANTETAPEPVAKPLAEKPVEATAPEPEPKHGENRVPVGELIAERKARQNLERQFNELIASLNATVPKQEPPSPPEIWDNPTEFVRQQVMPETDRIQRTLMYNARLTAEVRFGEDKVKAAQEAFDSLFDAQQLPQHEYMQVINSPNPFAEAVKWHERHRAISEVGTDLSAYKAKLRAELASDPEFRKEIMAGLQSEARSNPSARPVINLPSLSKTGAAALSSTDDDVSDDDLWKSTTRRKR